MGVICSRNHRFRPVANDKYVQRPSSIERCQGRQGRTNACCCTQPSPPRQNKSLVLASFPNKPSARSPSWHCSPNGRRGLEALEGMEPGNGPYDWGRGLCCVGTPTSSTGGTDSYCCFDHHSTARSAQTAQNASCGFINRTTNECEGRQRGTSAEVYTVVHYRRHVYSVLMYYGCVEYKNSVCALDAASVGRMLPAS